MTIDAKRQGEQRVMGDREKVTVPTAAVEEAMACEANE
jgi:hypothetical protein